MDDSTGTCNDFQPNCERPVSELLKLMEADAQLWNNLLYCTGGKLELSKCSFHILHFEFRPDGRPIASLDKYDNKIQLTDLETHTTVPIASKRAFDPHLTLGHLKSPTTQGKSALQNLLRKADRVSLLICTSPITRQGAYLAYQTVYLPTVRYTLPQSYFSRKTLDQAQCTSIHKLIAKCGYNRHTARALIYAPTAYAGGGFVPWYLLQGEGQIQQFIKHWRTDTLVSKTLRIAVSWLQWQAGWHRSVLEDTTSPILYLECRWLTSLRGFLQTIRGSLLLDQPFVQRRERQHDIYNKLTSILSGWLFSTWRRKSGRPSSGHYCPAGCLTCRNFPGKMIQMWRGIVTGEEKGERGRGKRGEILWRMLSGRVLWEEKISDALKLASNGFPFRMFVRNLVPFCCQELQTG